MADSDGASGKPRGRKWNLTHASRIRKGGRCGSFSMERTILISNSPGNTWFLSPTPATDCQPIFELRDYERAHRSDLRLKKTISEMQLKPLHLSMELNPGCPLKPNLPMDQT